MIKAKKAKGRKEKIKVIILGIDPGTTTGLAALDLNGGIVYLDSSKDKGRDHLVKTILELGWPVIIGADLKTVPKQVEKIATLLGCEVEHPKENLRVRDKKKIIEEHFKNQEIPKIHNSHEEDALFAAIFAYLKKRRLIKKIRVYVEKNRLGRDKERYFNQLSWRILKYKESIFTAKQKIKKGW